MPKLTKAFSSQNKINIFYLSALAPLVLIIYYNVFSAIIPLYGFLIFLIKREKLISLPDSGFLQKLLGSIIIVGSFFVYYVIVPFFPYVGFYGAANYATYLLGLFLFFFNLSAIKEAFSPLFLIVAATSSSIVSNIAEPHLSPYLTPSLQKIIETILRTLQIKFTTHSRVIVLQTWKGPLPLAFVWGCVGFYSTLVFSIILVVLLSENPSNIKTKLTWATIGLTGTLIINIIRITTIFIVDYHYGADVGGKIHYFIGYALFTAWLATFLYMFTKRQTIIKQIKSIKNKLHKYNKILFCL